MLNIITNKNFCIKFWILIFYFSLYLRVLCAFKIYSVGMVFGTIIFRVIVYFCFVVDIYILFTFSVFFIYFVNRFACKWQRKLTGIVNKENVNCPLRYDLILNFKRAIIEFVFLIKAKCFHFNKFAQWIVVHIFYENKWKSQ